MAVRFIENRRGGLTVDRDSLHESDGYKRQVEALKQLSEGEAVMGEKMTNAQAAELLRQHNAWRRGNDDEMPDAPVNPTRLGKAIDHAVAHLTQPAQAVDVGAIADSVADAAWGACQEDVACKGNVVAAVRDALAAALPNANGKEG